jgi:hypothetical protein
MARTTKPPQISFDDSLVILPKRQLPVTQTQRGNYEWSWLQADCYSLQDGTPVPIINSTFNTDVSFEFLVFGSDVPHTALYFAEQAFQAGYNNALKTWFTQANAFLQSVTAWGATLPPAAAFPTLVVPTAPSPVPYLCTSRASFLVRPSALSAVWGVTSDAGQGALVSCDFVNGDGDDTFVEGFPLTLTDLVCDPPSEPVSLVLDHLTLTVGFESGVNHGLGHAESTNTTPGYTPIILRLSDYTAAIRAAGNIINAGSLGLFYVVGLWYAPEEPV